MTAMGPFALIHGIGRIFSSRKLIGFRSDEEGLRNCAERGKVGLLVAINLCVADDCLKAVG